MDRYSAVACLVFLALAGCSGHAGLSRAADDAASVRTEKVADGPANEMAFDSSPAERGRDGGAVPADDPDRSIAHGGVIADTSCVAEPVVVWPEPFVASSMISATAGDDMDVIAFSTPAGDAMLVSIALADHRISSRRISENAEVSCIEKTDRGVRVGMIERDAKNGEYTAVVREYLPSLEETDSWRVDVRGFMPDPGTRCGFLDRRSVLVTGTRPRGERVPYHGLFKAQPRSLEFYESTQAHTPQLRSVIRRDGGAEILLREHEVAEDGTVSWPHTAYRLGKNTEMTKLASADFLLPDPAGGWIGILKGGCLKRDVGMICTGIPFELTGVSAVPDAACMGQVCMMWSTKNGDFFVEFGTDGDLGYKPLPEGERALYTQNYRISFEMDDVRPDVARGFRVFMHERGCIR